MKRFTKEQLESIKSNPFTARVTDNSITFTYEFKEFVMKKTQEGYFSVDIFRQAGYDVDALGKSYIYHKIKKIREEAASPGGLKQLKSSKRAQKFAEEDLKRHRTETSLKILQDRIVYLEQEIEFLKKTEILERELELSKQSHSSE